MQYMLLIHSDEAAMQSLPQEALARMHAAYMAYTEALTQAGVVVNGNRLRPTSATTTVRVVDGKTQVLDGPYAETKERLAGYYLIDVPDLDAALTWAARCPGAGAGTIEVRPIWGDVVPREADQPAAAAEAVARRCYGKLVAFLAARCGDVTAAEDALADAFAAALADWPASGIPRSPEAWLMAVAQRRLIDAARRRRTSGNAADHLRLIAEELGEASGETAMPDDRLGLMFACAHLAIDPIVRAPLILQTILGFDAAAIASAFLVSPATMGQRLVRAKHKIRHAGIPLCVPERAEMPQRLDAVLTAIYAAFAGGWQDAAQRNLGEEALWLGRLVALLLPDEPEALGLLALMLHAEARSAARRDANGAYVPLDQQDTARWDARMIEEAEALLRRASAMGVIGRYQLEAAVQSAHAARRLTGRSDWTAIERLYDALSAITDSPVVAINRAIAIAETQGAAVGLASLDALAEDRRLADYQPYWAARAELLARTGQVDAAHHAYDRAIGLEADPAAREYLQRRQRMSERQ